MAAGATVGFGVGSSTTTYFGATDLNNAFSGTFPVATVTTFTQDPASNVGIDTTQGSFSYAPSFATTTLGLNKLGGNTLTLTGSSGIYTGLTTVSAGTLQLGNGTTDFAPLSGNVVNNATLVYDLKGNQTYSGGISGSGNLVKTGAATLNFAPVNVTHSYTGATAITGGTLKLLPGTIAVNGFNGTTGDGAGWSVNSTSITTTAFTGGVLTLTDGTASEARSSYYMTRVPVSGPFNATFTYQAAAGSTATLADGAAIVLQNSPAGTAALGNGGGALGFDTTTPSAAIALNIYNGHTVGTNAAVNGVTLGGATNYVATGNVNLLSLDPIQVSLNYDGYEYADRNADRFGG